MVQKAGMATINTFWTATLALYSRRAGGDVITIGHITVELRWIKRV